MTDWAPTSPPELSASKPTQDILTVVAGEALNYLEPVYLHSDGKYYQSDANDTSKNTATGITLTNASADDYVLVFREGILTVPSITVTVAEIYVVSATGGIAPIGDLTTGHTLIVLGVGETAGTLDVKIWNTGYDKP